MRDELIPFAYQFDDVTIDCRDFRVTKNAEPRRITPRAFEVLLYLTQNAGRVVSKQELFDEVWRESFVTDNALTRMIKEVRQVIGDDAVSPHYIETVSKRGYRFIAEVTRIEKQSLNENGGIYSIAVLPFTNLSCDADSEYLSEAITESVINNLSRIPVLRVVPRSVVFSFGGREINPLEVGGELKVQAVASGRVLQRGENLIVSVELIDVAKEEQLWGEKYQYKTADMFDLQEEISRKISTQMHSRLIPQTQARPTNNPEAYRLYLKGRYFWNRRPQGLLKGIEYFERALERDENFALAHAGLADSYSTLGSWENGALPPNVAMPKACSAALKALKLDGNLAEAHTTLAYAKFHYDWKFKESEAEIRHAIEINPNYVHAHHWLSHIHMARGETDRSYEASIYALELEPLDLILNAHLVWHHWLAREPDKALSQAEKTRELEPNIIWPSFFAGLALEQQGLFEHAAKEFRRAQAITQQEITLVQAALGHALGNLGEIKKARKILEKLENQRFQKFVPAYDLAIVCIGLGEKNSAIEWLCEAEREHSGWLSYLAVEPRLDLLREMPEFGKLLARVGL